MAAAQQPDEQMSHTGAQEAFAALLLVGGQLSQRLTELCERYGITTAQYNVLQILARAPEGHARCDIARQLIERSPDVTRLIDRLERSGLVERGWSPSNRRLSVARLTPAGQNLLTDMQPEMCGLHREFATGLTADELDTLVRIGRKLAAGGA